MEPVALQFLQHPAAVSRTICRLWPDCVDVGVDRRGSRLAPSCTWADDSRGSDDDAKIRHRERMPTKREATIEDLYRVEGKAEIVNGEIVMMAAAGGLHNWAGGEIFASLREHARRTKSGWALTDNAGFVVKLPKRRSFSPDVAFYVGRPTRKFFEGAPVFAVEIRSEEEYGPAAERAMASKRADYFAAGTLAVWDVDVLRDARVRVYLASQPDQAKTYSRGETANAEPAVPGWTFAVDDLFLPDV